MISYFSLAEVRVTPPMRSSPCPRRAFFQHPVLQQQFGHHLLELLVLLPQPLHLAAGGLAFRVARQPCFACFQEFFAPLVVQIRR